MNWHATRQLTRRLTTLLEKLIFLQLTKKFPACMESWGSFVCFQKITSVPNTEAEEFSPQETSMSNVLHYFAFIWHLTWDRNCSSEGTHEAVTEYANR
jgi:hypothetical protein